MSNNNSQKIEYIGLKDVARTYFKGLTDGYSQETIETYKKVLTNRYGISDFEKLRQDFKAGAFD